MISSIISIHKHKVKVVHPDTFILATTVKISA